LFETKQALLAAAQDFFDRSNQCPKKILSVIGSKAENISCLYLEVHSSTFFGMVCAGQSRFYPALVA
jgi:hypothetical protein